MVIVHLQKNSKIQQPIPAPCNFCMHFCMTHIRQKMSHQFGRPIEERAVTHFYIVKMKFFKAFIFKKMYS